MGSICILTDNAAQFTQPGFSGREDVWQISYNVRLNGTIYPDDEGLKSTSLPASAGDGLQPALIVPEVKRIQETLHDLAGKYREIIAILTSSELTPLYASVELAAVSIRGKIPVTLIDSQSIALGLGLMVQSAAEAAARGVNGVEIERSVRRMIPRTYSLFASAGLTYLYHAGFIDEGQAIIGEMLRVVKPGGLALVGSIPDDAVRADFEAVIPSVAAKLDATYGPAEQLPAGRLSLLDRLRQRFDGVAPSIVCYYFNQSDFAGIATRLGAQVRIADIHALNPYKSFRFNAIFSRAAR